MTPPECHQKISGCIKGLGDDGGSYFWVWPPPYQWQIKVFWGSPTKDIDDSGGHCYLEGGHT